MTTIHMNTDTVRVAASQLEQNANAIFEAMATLNSQVKSVGWEGPSSDSYRLRFSALVRQFEAVSEQASALGLRVQREVNEWEGVDTSGKESLSKSVVIPQTEVYAPDKTDWLSKQLFINLYELQKVSIGPDGTLLNLADRLLLFYEFVRTGGIWDYKSNLFKAYSEAGIELFGKTYANDVPGNIMYGFIGASLARDINTITHGLINAEDVLLGFAGYVQTHKNASKDELIALLLDPQKLSAAKGSDDPLDANAIKLGIELYKQGGSEDSLKQLLESADLRTP